MIIDLAVPYCDNDLAKRAGAKWDAGRQTWFVHDPEDIYVFTRWLPTLKREIKRENDWLAAKKDADTRQTVREYLCKKYNTKAPLTMLKSEAKIFGIPYPLRTGWVERYGDEPISAAMEKRLFDSMVALGTNKTTSRAHYARQGLAAICHAQA